MVSFYPFQAGAEGIMKVEGAAAKAEGNLQNWSIPEAPRSCVGRRGEPSSRGWEVG